MRSHAVRWTLCALLVAGGGAILASHDLLVRVAGGRGAYPLGTAFLLILAGLVVWIWPPRDELPTIARPRRPVLVLTCVAGLAVLGSAASRALSVVFRGPLDPQRGDMLVIMEHAIKRLLAGGNPYTVHHVPWDAPLSYGPLLWLPHLFSYLLGFDFRIFTLISQLVIPALCFLSASVRAGQGLVTRAVVLFGLGAGIALHPSLLGFHEIGHTQVYWPGFAVFCLLMSADRFTAAAVCLGLLASARTPLVSLAPVFFLYLHVKNSLTLNRALVFAAALLLPFLPFLIVDPGAVKVGMFDTYVRVMKTFVWTSTAWAVNTYGITGRLLEHGKQAYVEVTQLVCLAVVYFCAWRSMKRGGRPEPWLAFALLIFSMTTLWSVLYLYYDVWLFLTCALIANDRSLEVLSIRRPAVPILVAFALAATVVLASAAATPGSRFKIDIGAPSAAGYTGGGFGADLPEIDDGRVVVWVEGPRARIRLPRAGWTGANIRVAIRPNVLSGASPQVVIAALNDRALGSATLKDGWQEITFRSRRADWLYGFNVLDLFFSYAAPREPAPIIPGQAAKDFSAAIDFVVVE